MFTKKGHKKSIAVYKQNSLTRICLCSAVLEQTMVFTHICIQRKSDHRQPDVVCILKLLEYHVRTSTTTAVHDLTSL